MRAASGTGGTFRRGSELCPQHHPCAGTLRGWVQPRWDPGTLSSRAQSEEEALLQGSGCIWGQLGVVPSPVEVTKPPRLPCVCGAPAEQAVAARVPPTGGEAVVSRERN